MMHPDNASCDWQLSKESLVDRMKIVLRTSQWSDCVFRVGPEDDHQMFRVHKLILAASSPVFGAMCFGPLAEKSCISVPDIEPHVFEILLE
ncbi:hypothetical protein PR048_023906 [Dryococelus australis]|uniref:BTB domain-containing protein n=1 Tax=Dryococelus australis TaxID=614101 RepID=A0ABQ9GVC5_9NEOP|nr:hypothetical protein PR048_023906 [Dryococelus australis]